jgi:HPt (histidine-containing phosphotransfer) domain-containing protein
MKRGSNYSSQFDLQANQEEVRQKLDELFKGYILRLPEKLESIRSIVNSLHTDQDSGRVLNQLHTLVHKLAGSAGTYGCPEVGKVARDCELLVTACLDSGTRLGPEDLERLEERYGDLAMAVELAVNSAT